ncbi:SGNH hydrolase domain-containing protein [Mesorhizobium sp.]|uniref:SGNH hydrolase domain-containing protein n=1 Tax=Mesorhizobium sp. TaxID=1871066 RepID=UPI003BAB289C
MRSDKEFARDRLKATLDWLTGLGITPVLVSPVPIDGSDIGGCLVRSRWLGTNGRGCEPSITDVRESGANVRRMLDSFSSQYKVINLDDFLCGETFCKIRDGDVMIYRDGAHLSHEGSRYLGASMHFYDQIMARLLNGGSQGLPAARPITAGRMQLTHKRFKLFTLNAPLNRRIYSPIGSP